MNDDKALFRRPIIEYSDEERYRVLEGGAIFDKEIGKIVAHLPGQHRFSITKANAGEMQKRGVAARKIRELRGLALGAGIELPPDADLETIVNAAESAWEALIAHTYQVYMKSNNVRGLGEILPKLASAFGWDEGDDQNQPLQAPAQIVLLLAELARRDDSDVIDVNEEA